MSMVRGHSGLALALLRAVHFHFACGLRVVRENTESRVRILPTQGQKCTTQCESPFSCKKFTDSYSECVQEAPKLGQQCGGMHWQGPTECESPSVCKSFTASYSECIQDQEAPMPAPSPALLLAFGAQGQASCPGSALSKDQCREAAKQLAYEFQGAKNNGKVPSGCFLDVYADESLTGLYYNNRFDGTGSDTTTPICAKAPAGAPTPGGLSLGLPDGVSFESLMGELQNQGVSQGGYACGYSAPWCGCSCGHNLGREVPCYLPPMNPGTEGGHTCGWLDQLYGCAEAHNTLEGCPRTSTHGGAPGGGAPSPLSGKGGSTPSPLSGKGGKGAIA